MGTITSNIDRQDKEKYSYQKMLSYGWNPVQASAIIGNLKHESGFRTSVEGDKGYKGGSSFGIAQWRGNRLMALKAKYGSNWQDLDNQLEFVNYELNNTHTKAGKALKKITTSIFNAGRVVSDDYEVPAVKFYANDDRQNTVYDVYRKYSGMKLTTQDKIDMMQGEAQRVQDNYRATQNITPNLTTLAMPTINSNFTEVSPQEKVEEQEAEEEEDTAQAKAELYQKQNEEDFFNNYLNTQQTAPKTEQYEPTYEEVAQQDPYDVTTPYNEAEQFVEMREGGEKNSLWKNIRVNRGSGKAPTKQMLEQEIKIKNSYQEGGFIKDNMGQWKYPGQVTEIQGNSMATHGYGNIPLYVVPDVGNPKIVFPNTGNHFFKGASKFVEYPIVNKKFYNGE